MSESMHPNRADFDDPAADMSEGLIEQLLCEAYEAPAMPRSLERRLSAEAARQWKVSPELLLPEPGGILQLSRRGLRTFRAWPIAACLALALTLAFALRGDSRAYGWAAMIEAISRQPIVQISGQAAPRGMRWLSAPESKLAQESNGAVRLYDFGGGVLLERPATGSQIRRARMNKDFAAIERDRLVIAFLLDGAEVDAAGPRLSDMHVVEETWSRRGDAVELVVTLESQDANQSLKLTLTLDPESKLPHSGRIVAADGGIRELTFAYPAVKPAELRSRSFPAGAPVVDVGFEAFSPSIAAASARVEDGAPTKAPNAAVSTAQATVDDKDLSPLAPLAGAASLEWSPPPVSKLSDEEALQRVDSALKRLWRENQIEPAALATEEELLRRAYLDLVGRTPTVTEVRSYLGDASPDKYVGLVDRLLASRDHATHLAAVWRAFLLPEGVDLSRFGGVRAFETWLGERFAAHAPYDQLVRELLLAEGRLSKSGPLAFYAALKLDPDQLAARTSRVFLGMRLECAQCHDDPFEPWTQRDFWSYAAFFAQISRPEGKLESVSTVMRVHDVGRGEVKLPDSETVAAPRFLDGSAIDESPGAAARRPQLALWLTSAENPYFARAAVNRVWAHLFGAGIVDPVDGFGKRHRPRSAELLDLLAGQFIRDQFDLRRLFRTIALSRAYRLSSGAETADEKRHECFAQMNVKMLTAEQLYDCITVASMLIETQSEGFSLARTGNSRRDEFLQQFQSLSGRVTEYQGGIPQALTLMNGTLIGQATDLAEGGLLKSLEAPFFSDDERIEVLYLATLSRRPSPQEWKLLRRHLADREPGGSLDAPLADILWALLNGAEFTMNH